MQTMATCFNLPAGANCNYNAQTQTITIATGLSTPAGTYQILVVSTVSPQATASVSGHSSKGGLLYGLLGLPLGLIWVGRKRRRWLYPAAGVLGLLLIFVAGCSSGKTPTSPTTSQASTTLTLTVN